ncbi:hypothetical protein, variant [Verruconis gallopava]|nr:hypothetical protein, variant [Verruconis gallopava]KIW06496.1 hypothetical protein, variant [Verruconis gallopava]
MPIKDHKVLYNYDVHIPVRMTIDKNGVLQDTIMQFDVIHEVSHTEKIHLGLVKLNLAEYVEASEAGAEDEGVVRRYLMQDSKINSTLKVGIYLKQVDGDRNFSAPPLRVAPVFSGIAGHVVGEVDDNEGIPGSSTAPVISAKSQIAGDELRELYRRTIAANWTCLPGELSADKVIEDIFSGGDGWLSKPPVSGDSSGASKFSDDDRHGVRGHARRKSEKPLYFSKSRADIKRHSKENMHVARGDRPNVVRGRGSFEQQAHSMGVEAEKGSTRDKNEFDELEIREDLRSWKLPS